MLERTQHAALVTYPLSIQYSTITDVWTLALTIPSSISLTFNVHSATTPVMGALDLEITNAITALLDSSMRMEFAYLTALRALSKTQLTTGVRELITHNAALTAKTVPSAHHTVSAASRIQMLQSLIL